MTTEPEIEVGRVGPVTCPVCSSETQFWMQANGRAMCPCSARRAFTPAELGLPSGTSETQN